MKINLTKRLAQECIVVVVIRALLGLGPQQHYIPRKLIKWFTTMTTTTTRVREKEREEEEEEDDDDDDGIS